jgi:hypothetical protein
MDKYVTLNDTSLLEMEEKIDELAITDKKLDENHILSRLKNFEKNYGKPIKLVILTPCYGGVTFVNYMICLINTIEFFRKVSTITIHVEFCKNDSLVTRARNNLVAKAMNIPDVTHLMFIDNDITWNPNEIVKLLISDKDVIGGAYPLKKYNWDYILNGGNIKEKIENKKTVNDINKYFDDETILKSQLLKYNMNVFGNELKIENNVTEIRHLPTGFMMFKRGVIEKMMVSYSETKYTDDIGFLSKEENQYAYALFDTGLMDGHYLSEDWYFCERWAKIGGKINMDVSIILSHTGSEDYTGCFILSVQQ